MSNLAEAQVALEQARADLIAAATDVDALPKQATEPTDAEIDRAFRLRDRARVRVERAEAALAAEVAKAEQGRLAATGAHLQRLEQEAAFEAFAQKVEPLVWRLPDPKAQSELDAIADTQEAAATEARALGSTTVRKLGRRIVTAFAVRDGKQYHQSELGLEGAAIGSDARAIQICKLVQDLSLGAFCGPNGWHATAEAWLAGADPMQAHLEAQASVAAYLREAAAKENAERRARKAAKDKAREEQLRLARLQQVQRDEIAAQVATADANRRFSEWKLNN